MAYGPTLNALKRVALKFNTEIKRTSKSTHKFKLSELAEIHARYEGRCVFCGMPLKVQESTGKFALHYKFYTPLEFGGPIHLDNVIIVCSEHVDYIRPTKEVREEIPDINTIADIIEQLVKSVIQREKLISEDSKGVSQSIEKTRRIKRLLNFKLEDLALNMRYKPFRDWEPSEFVLMKEENNTIPDLIENTAKDLASGQVDESVLKSNREQITERIKQTVKTRKYKIIRNDK